LTEKKESSGDREVDLIMNNSGSSSNINGDSSCGNTFNNFDDDDFSPTFNVPDMDISAGKHRAVQGHGSLRTRTTVFECCVGKPQSPATESMKAIVQCNTKIKVKK